MRYIYATRIDTILSEVKCVYTVYGIDAIDLGTGNVLCSCPDIFTDLFEAEHTVELLNKEGLELVHLHDVIDDIITKNHTHVN